MLGVVQEAPLLVLLAVRIISYWKHPLGGSVTKMIDIVKRFSTTYTLYVQPQ